MKLRLIALSLCLVLAAGCATASQGGQDAPQNGHKPSYSYVNPDPDMVLITSADGDITYENYRLYLDFNEQINRFMARQDMGVCAALEKDFADMGIEIDEEDFKALASQQLLSAMVYRPSFAESLEQIAKETGLSEPQVTDAIMLSFRPQYLIELLGEYYQRLAIEQLDKEAGDAKTAPEDREMAEYELAMSMMQEYSSHYETRLSFDDASALVTIDGVDIPNTEVTDNYITYAGIANRIDSIAFIQAGELALRELERRDTTFDRADFETTFDEYISTLRADEQAMQQFERICADLGATTDDYFKALERPLWLQEIGDRYYLAMAEEYNALALDSGENDADSADSYYVQQLGKLLDGSEIVNITGK